LFLRSADERGEGGPFCAEQKYDKGSVYSLYLWLLEIYYLYQKYIVYVCKTYDLPLMMNKIEKPQKVTWRLGNATLEIKTTGGSLIFQRTKSEIEKYTKNISDDLMLLSLPDDPTMIGVFSDELIDKNQLVLSVTNVPFYCYVSEKNYFKIFDYFRNNTKLFESVLEEITFLGYIYELDFLWPDKIQTNFLKFISKLANDLGMKVQIDLTNLSTENSYNDISDEFVDDIEDEKLKNIVYCLDGGKEAFKLIEYSTNSIMRELVKSLNKYPNVKVIGKTFRKSELNYKCKFLETTDSNTICKIAIDLE
jgi:hypothetical protein